MQKNTATKWVVFAWTTATSLPKTGDAANITGSVRIDGGADNPIDDTNPTELAGGYYAFDITAAECNGDNIVIIPASSTAGVQVIGVPGAVWTEKSIAQTGDNYARLGAPAGASVSADVLQVKNYVDDIGAAGAGLTALGDTRLANLDAAVSSRLAPTVAARTLDVAATGEAGLDFNNILDASGAHTLTNITVPVVTTTGTATNLTNLPAAAATAAELAKVPKSDSTVTWNATALASINAEVDGALNTAIPGSPTADSINERVKAIDDLTQASGAGDLASVNTKIGTPSNLGGGATLAANLSDIEGQTDDIGIAGAGLTALGDTRLANLDAAVSTRSAPGTAQTITANQAVNVAQWGGSNIVTPAVTGSPVVTLGATQAAYAPAKAGDSMAVSDKTGFALTSAYDPAKTAAQALALATAQTDLDTLTGADGATLATLQANYAPAKAGNQMDLVAAPNATAVTAIQSGLATPTNITAGTITTVTNLTNAPTVGDLTAAMKSSVNAEVVDAFNVDTYAEPTGAPAATASLAAKIGRLYQALRNKLTVASSAKTFYSDAGASLWSKTLSDDGTTYTEDEGA